jgi:hypothetical protein
MNRRFADAQFEFLNTREACTIDRSVLEGAMRRALSDALKKFGIPDPSDVGLDKRVGESVDATRAQCGPNADKYVSNETFSSVNWDTDKATGDLTAKAYAAAPDARGGFQKVLARESSWPADGRSAIAPSDTTEVRVLGRRVTGQAPAPSFDATGPAVPDRPVSLDDRAGSQASSQT